MIENAILQGDSLDLLKTLPDGSVDCCVTSPPYYLLRDYGEFEGQIGMEDTPEEYIDHLMVIFREVRRVLKDTGTLWVNLGDTYAGSRKGQQGKREYLNGHVPTKVFMNEQYLAKQLIGIPWRFALAMQNEWFLRQDIIWAKSNPMPEPCKDRFCKSHEYLFLFSKQQKYYFNHKNALEEAITYNRHVADPLHERGYKTKADETNLFPQYHGNSIAVSSHRTMRDVWFIATEVSEENHYAMFPQKLILPCILCGCPENGIVLDPFMGSGTTAIVAMKHFRRFIGCEINPEYVRIAEARIQNERGLFDV